jgi:hypothetical protein
VKTLVLVKPKNRKPYIQTRESAKILPYLLASESEKPLPGLKAKTKELLAKAGIQQDTIGKFEIIETPDRFYSDKEYGQVEIFDNKARILINPRAKNKLVAAVHELGHVWDLRNNGVVGINSDLLSPLVQTPKYKQLLVQAKTNPVPSNIELIKPEELFARTFVALIAYKTRDSRLINELKRQHQTNPEYTVDLPEEFVEKMDAIILEN